jgi:hypothetical protein
MITRDEAKKLWDQVVANSAKLDACPGPHEFFDISPETKMPLGKKYRCSKCDGETEGSHVRWYRRGLEHAQVRCPVST